jgi:chromatin segregation and condensation protein Rec8/ScpA/Scc1 (kleisin family)
MSVGTRLTVLKSRSLLPKPPSRTEDDEPEPDDLVEQLKAYKRLKVIAAELGKRRDADLVSYSHRGTGPVARRTGARPQKLAQYEATVLVRALRRRLSTIPAAVQMIRQRRIVSIREMTDRVLEMVGRFPRLRFSQVVEGYGTRSETATAFLAMLVLIRRRSIDAAQAGLFEEISLSTATDSEADAPGMDVEDEFLN